LFTTTTTNQGFDPLAKVLASQLGLGVTCRNRDEMMVVVNKVEHNGHGIRGHGEMVALGG
jgi:hypothetical protein